jgi:hypothetical protein
MFKKMLVTAVVVMSILPFFPKQIAFAQQGSFKDDLNAQTQAAAGSEGAGFGAPQDPRATVARLIQTFLSILGILLLGYIIYGGSLIFMSGGSEDKIAEGKKVIQHAVIGLVITLSAYSITIFVSKLVQGDGGPCAPDANGNIDCAIVEEDRRRYNNPNFDDTNPFTPGLYDCNYLPDGTCDLQN